MLNLTPYDSDGNFKCKLLPSSYTEIQAVHVICPSSTICVNKQCTHCALLQNTRPRDVPLVTLIKDNIPYADVPVLSGKCIQCGTIYYADHEHFIVDFINPGEAPFLGLKSKFENFHISLPYVP